jgi:DNA-directed RNA polymerase subunit E'/Rpb7
MFNTNVIVKPIFININEIDKNLKKNVENNVRKMFENMCNNEYGYILDVTEIKMNNDYFITRSSNKIVVHPEITFNSIKPCVGDIYLSKVKMVFKQGIFVSVYDKFNCLIVKDKFPDYVFVKDKYIKKSEEEDGEDKTISMDDEMNIIIQNVSFDKNNFNCIADLSI